MMSRSMVVQGYASLRKQVEEALLLGRREIEKAKVHTYWRTGKLIADHIKRYGTREERYGNQVTQRLAKDLDSLTRSSPFLYSKFDATFVGQ